MEIQYSPADFLEARKLYLKTNLAHKIWLVLTALWALFLLPSIFFAAAIPAIIIISSTLKINPPLLKLSMTFISDIFIFLIGTVPFLGTWLQLFYRIRVARTFKTQKQMKEKIEFTFNEDGTSFKRELYSSQQKWAYYHSILEGQNVFLLFINKKTYSVIPKRCFASEDELALFRKFVRPKVGV